MKTRKIRIAVLVALSVFSLQAVQAAADVTVERFTKTGGIAGIGANESTSTTMISGLRKRESSSIEMKGAVGSFLGKLTGGMASDTITDVPADREVSLDHKKKTFTETAISLPEEDREVIEGREPAGGSEDREEQPRVKVVRNELSVKETGETKTVNGFDCARYLLTWELETEDLDTGARSLNTMTTDLWTTPETKATRALAQEEEAFQRAYLKKLGIDASPEEMKRFGLSMMAGLTGGDETSMRKDAERLRKEMAKVKGYPIVTTVEWRSSETGGEAAAPEEESGGPDLTKGLGGLFSGLAKKVTQKKSSGDQEGGRVIFDSYTEIRRIDTSGIPGDRFDVPAGYARAQ